MSASRKTVREQFAAVLSSALVGSGKPVQALYDYQIGDFDGQSPVVVVTSGPIERTRLSAGPGWQSRVTLYVYSFVVYAVPGTAWTEADAEDSMDTIETAIADAILANTTSSYWHHITYAGTTVTDGVEIGGVEYRREIIPVQLTLYS